jgi:hypothetical protein
MIFSLDEKDRQATLLALAELSLSRPGWLAMLTTVAARLGGVTLFEQFRLFNADRIGLNYNPMPCCGHVACLHIPSSNTGDVTCYYRDCKCGTEKP